MLNKSNVFMNFGVYFCLLIEIIVLEDNPRNRMVKLVWGERMAIALMAHQSLLLLKIIPKEKMILQF